MASTVRFVCLVITERKHNLSISLSLSLSRASDADRTLVILRFHRCCSRCRHKKHNSPPANGLLSRCSTPVLNLLNPDVMTQESKPPDILTILAELKELKVKVHYLRGKVPMLEDTILQMRLEIQGLNDRITTQQEEKACYQPKEEDSLQETSRSSSKHQLTHGQKSSNKWMHNKWFQKPWRNMRNGCLRPQRKAFEERLSVMTIYWPKPTLSSLLLSLWEKQSSHRPRRVNIGQM
ncbi:hypothetical protein O6H91_05G002900 [Diphasiastrum complanatum]|uniref:Uncharacterized protein n=1 Tax=Diphasiastrum complanatum TaxID=34168 RepID=A0ACC2DKH8_DIPCM|nr:hypothetical protein O6H91_05G002900 [Diphasiastrum complanatum]